MDLTTPISEEVVNNLHVGDIVTVSGDILCGRDAVLPRIVKMIENEQIKKLGIDLNGQAVFHTAVSVAGIGPTSSNKLEIEESIQPLSKAGVRLHIGKGALHVETIRALNQYHAVYALIPPVTALLGKKTGNPRVVAFPDLGMEALYVIEADKYPVVIAAAHGRSIYE